MKTTSRKFRDNPAHVYRAADKGATVEIEHKHYPDKRFVLTAEDKEEQSGFDKFVEGLGDE